MSEKEDKKRSEVIKREKEDKSRGQVRNNESGENYSRDITKLQRPDEWPDPKEENEKQ